MFRRISLGNSVSDEDIKPFFSQLKSPHDLGKLLKQFATDGYKHYYDATPLPRNPVHVAITGAAGAIGYALLPRIASGEMLGSDQPVILHLLERTDAMKALQGVVMELQDCAFPLLHDIIATDNVDQAFERADYAILVGAKPRGPGMERGDLLSENAKIFIAQGQALDKCADADCLVLVVGNPANTNALIAASQCRNIPKENFSAMTRLDHDRGLAQIAQKLNCSVDDIERFCIWGNHSSTQFPDLNNAVLDRKWIRSLINDDKWITDTFIPTVQKRGAAIIAARGSSSATSAADAALKHMHDWVLGSSKWTSMAVPSDGTYGVPSGVYCSFPVQCLGSGQYGVMENVVIDDFAAKKIQASVDELFEERSIVESMGMLPKRAFTSMPPLPPKSEPVQQIPEAQKK